jgi:hypothetical protein
VALVGGAATAAAETAPAYKGDLFVSAVYLSGDRYAGLPTGAHC